MATASSLNSSKQFSEQIKQLEAEGNKLLEATAHLGETLGVKDPWTSSSNGYGDNRGITGTPSLSALADISAEQKTIADLRTQLDAQSKETERLQKELFGGKDPYKAYEPPSSNLANLDIPISTPMSAPVVLGLPSGGLPTSSYDYTLSSSTDRHLHQSQEEIAQLRTRLREAQVVSDKQKGHFRTTIEELKNKLQDAVMSRDSMMELKKRETYSQEALIQKLQRNMEQLEQTNRIQEQTLLEMNDKLEKLQKDQYMADSAFNHIRGLLLDRERRRGRGFYENEPVAKQSVNVLVHSLEKCLQEMEREIVENQEKIGHTMIELEEARLTGVHKCETVQRESDRKFTDLQEKYERDLNTQTERQLMAKEQCTTLAEQISILQQQLDSQTKLKDEHIRDLEHRVLSQRQEFEEERRLWNTKRSATELALDETQKDLAIMKGERDDSIRKMAAIESRFNDMQNTIDGLGKELKEEREKHRKTLEDQTEFRAKEERMKIEIKHKEEIVKRLEENLKSVKQEYDNQLKSTVSSMEKEGKEYIEKQITGLRTQLDTMTEKCHQLQLELEVTKSEYKNLNEKVGELRDTNDKLNMQLENACQSKEHVNLQFKNVTSDLDRVTLERDKYYSLLDERNKENATLKTLKEKLTIQLEEREKNFLTLQQQNDKMSSVTELNSVASSNLKKERDDLLSRMNDKIIETEEIRHQRDSLGKKLRIREKHVQELEDDNVKLAEEVKITKTEIEKVVEEKDSMYHELKDSRYEVSNLNEEREGLQRRLKEREQGFAQENTRLTQRLKAAEHDLKLARKTLRTREEVDGKAVKVAGKMQKQVTEKRGQIDTLQSKLRWLEECLDASLKDKKVVEEDTDKLANALRKATSQNERLADQVQIRHNENSQLMAKISKLESALEKAALKHSSSQAQVQKYEQEIARLKLKHNLDLKELSRGPQPPPANSTGALVTSYKPVKSGTSSSKPPVPMSKSEKSRLKKAEKEKLENDNGVVGEELKSILSEMRGLLKTQKDHANQKASGHPQSVSDSELTVERGPSSHRSHPKSHHRRPDRDGNQRGDRDGNQRGDRDRPISPVSDLLGGTLRDDTELDSMLSGFDNTAESSSAYFGNGATLPSNGATLPSKGLYTPNPLPKDTQAMCDRLNRKIEGLTKLGGKLQKDNEDFAKMMKNDEKKLKKVKSQLGK